jgi:peptidoglycan/LPS O-acetylase OafA/YrhL
MISWRPLLSRLYNLPNTVGRPVSRAYIPELDGLRFIALFFVLVWHASIRAVRYYSVETGNTGGDGYYWIFPHGEIGVVVFFFISGFVVSQPFLGRPSSQWNIKSFYIRRFIRIYPPYLIVLVLCYFALQIIGHVPTGANSYNQTNIPLSSSFMASAFYVHSVIFNTASRLNPPIWSLELEILFYAAAPLLLMLYTRIASRTARLLSMCLVILSLVVMTACTTSLLEIDGRYRWGMLCHGYLFLLGILAADIVGDSLSRPRKTTTFSDFIFLLGIGGIIAIGLQMTQVDARLSGGWSTLTLQLSTALSLALLFIGAFYGTASSQFLRLPWIRLIGTMCYSVYLCHIIAMQACSEILGRILHVRNVTLIWGLHFAVLIPVGIGTGLVFYICVERPFATLAANARRRVASVEPVSIGQCATLGAPLPDRGDAS